MQGLVDALQRAVSQDAKEISSAESQLAEMAKMSNFYLALLVPHIPNRQQTFGTPSVDSNIRWISLIYFKNGIDKFWKKNQEFHGHQEEKQQIRAALVWLLFREQSDKFAKMLCLNLAKIARMDFPVEWPDIFYTPLSQLTNPQPHEQKRALQMIHEIVKILASRMLPSSKTQIATNLVSVLGVVFDYWTDNGRVHEDKSSLGYLALKAWRLTFSLICKSNLKEIFDSRPFQSVLSFLPESPVASKQFLLLFQDILDSKVLSVISCLSPLFPSILQAEKEEARVNLLLRNMLEFEKREAKGLFIVSDPGFCPLLLKKNCINSAEWEQWCADSEDFYFQTDVRNAESLTGMFASIYCCNLTLSTNDIGWKLLEACLNALASGPNDIILVSASVNVLGKLGTYLSRVQLSELFFNRILPVVQQFSSHGSKKLLYKSVASLSASWISAGLEYGDIFSFILYLMSSESDAALQLGCIEAIGKCTEDWSFSVDMMEPHLDRVFSIFLSNGLSQTDSFLLILNNLSIILDKMKHEECLKQHSREIALKLVELWNSKEKMVKTMILSILSKLSPLLHREFSLIPQFAFLISESIRPDLDSHVYLLDDALEFWLKLLSHMQVLPDDFLLLYPSLLNLIEISSENLKRVVDLMQVYFAFQNSSIVDRTVSVFEEKLALILLSVSACALVPLLRMVQFFIAAYPVVATCKCMVDLALFCQKEITKSDEYNIINSYSLVLCQLAVLNPSVVQLLNLQMDYLSLIKHKRIVCIALMLAFHYQLIDNDTCADACNAVFSNEDLLTYSDMPDDQEDMLQENIHRKRSIQIEVFDSHAYFVRIFSQIFREIAPRMDVQDAQQIASILENAIEK